MQKPSLLLVGNYSNKTGYAWNNIYRLYKKIVIEFDKLGVPVYLSFPVIEPPIDFIPAEHLREPIRFNIQTLDLSSLINLRRNIRQHNIRYVYLTDQPAFCLQYALLRIIGIKRIITHSRVSVASPHAAPPEIGLRRLVKSTLSSISFWSADRIYAVSNFVKTRLVNINCIPENKVVVILNGINIEKFNCDKKETNNIIRIFCGARANAYKGILTLIEAVRLLVEKQKHTNFVVEYAGDGPDIGLFREKVDEYHLNKFFHFLGELRDTKEAICAADVVVVPSNWGDACPSSVSEALAAGKPLITTNAGGIPEIVGDGNNAILIAPADEHALAENLGNLISDPNARETLGRNARARAIKVLDETFYYQKAIKQLIADLLD